MSLVTPPYNAASAEASCPSRRASAGVSAAWASTQMGWGAWACGMLSACSHQRAQPVRQSPGVRSGAERPSANMSQHDPAYPMPGPLLQRIQDAGSAAPTSVKSARRTEQPSPASSVPRPRAVVAEVPRQTPQGAAREAQAGLPISEPDDASEALMARSSTGPESSAPTIAGGTTGIWGAPAWSVALLPLLLCGHHAYRRLRRRDRGLLVFEPAALPAGVVEQEPSILPQEIARSGAVVGATDQDLFAAPGCSLDMQWVMYYDQRLQWRYWFNQPAVDFTDVASAAPFAPAAEAAVAEAPSALNVLAAAVLAVAPSEAEPAPEPAPEPEPEPEPMPASTPALQSASARPAAPPMDLIGRLQQDLDAVLDAAHLSVARMPGSCQPLLYPQRKQLSGDAAALVLRTVDTSYEKPLSSWLHAATLNACHFDVTGVPAEAAFDQAVDITVRAASLQDAATADWQALWLRLQLRWLERQGVAARMLGLARLKGSFDRLSCSASVAVRSAWVDVLHAWAAEQQGPAAMRRLEEAAHLCSLLLAVPASRAEGERLMAVTLLKRSRIEKGGLRQTSLHSACAHAERAYAGTQAPHAGLSLAWILLEQARLGGAAEAVTALLERGFQFTMIAAKERRLEASALQCRLAILLAYEAIHGEGQRPAISLQLAEQMATGMELAADTWLLVVTARHRSGQYRQACEAAAVAARQGPVPAGLMDLWERASAEWGRQEMDDVSHRHWQDNARERQVASQQPSR